MMRNRRHNKAAGCLAALIAACGIFISDSASGASDVTGSSLDDVRREIGEHRTRAESNERDLNSVRSEIETNRREAERITRQLSSDQKRIDSISESLSQINEKIRSLEEQKERQKDMIARQLVEAYKIGKNDYLKLVLSQKDPAATDRALEYYRYINEARVQAVRDIEKTEAELREALKKRSDESRELQKLQDRPRSDIKKLSEIKERKKAAEKSLSESLKEERSEIARLEEDERQIQGYLVKLEEERKAKEKAEKERLEKLKAEQERTARLKAEEERKRKAEEAGRKKREEQEKAERLAAEQQRKEAELAAAEKAREIRRHSLSWPSTGQVLNKFGSIRSGQVRWKGLLFSTGNNLVKAAGSGTVVMVTSMKRLGTVIIVEHGGGFISIYCNNLNSLKKQGDHVEQGELIGYTGSSQGLYFELRKDGESVSPAEYLRRR